MPQGSNSLTLPSNLPSRQAGPIRPPGGVSLLLVAVVALLLLGGK